MKLKNCKISIEPKGAPEEAIVFWNADCTYDSNVFNDRRDFTPPIKLDMALDIYPESGSSHLRRYGYIDVLSVADRQKLDIIKKRLMISDKIIRKLGEQHLDVFVMAGDMLELIRMIEDKGSAEP